MACKAASRWLLLLFWCAHLLLRLCSSEIDRSQFPPSFLFGTSTSAYQIEGGYLEGKKGLSNWDVYTHKQGTIEDGSNGDIAADHYHRYMVQLRMEAMVILLLITTIVIWFLDPIILGYAQASNRSMSANDFTGDMGRIDYMSGYLEFLASAIRKGADVRGYFVWSLLDDFEWTSGFTDRFGLYHVDFKTLKRTPKLSAEWYRKFLQGSLLTREFQNGSQPQKYTS
ncbi:hypothetical protein ACQ4PT_065184 [Festuca glaucescens]